MAAGSGLATLGIAGSPGVPEELAALTTVVPYNDASALEAAFTRFQGEIAAFILEPLAANMGVVLPADGYLQAARDLATRHGALLIFDEVISGFRVAAGGAQEIYGVAPDLTTLGKILGGGLPVGAYGGRRDLMEKMAPSGAVYQAGTLSGNPLAMSAGIAMLDEIARRPPYAELEQKGAALEALLRAEIERRGLSGRGLPRRARARSRRSSSRPARCADFARRRSAPTRGGLPCSSTPCASAASSWPPAQFEAWFLSTAHSDAEIRRTARMAGESLALAARRELGPSRVLW